MPNASGESLHKGVHFGAWNAVAIDTYYHVLIRRLREAFCYAAIERCFKATIEPVLKCAEVVIYRRGPRTLLDQNKHAGFAILLKRYEVHRHSHARTVNTLVSAFHPLRAFELMPHASASGSDFEIH